MAKKVTINGNNLLSSLSDDWGGVNTTQASQTIHGTTVPPGAEWGMNRGEVERFIKSSINAQQSRVGYYVCDNAASTSAKTVVVSGYQLATGGCIRIKMNNANTANNVTLNINSTGAKALYYDGTQASATNTWEAGEVLEVYYDGTQFQCVSSGGGRAERVKYDNAESGLQATNVQGAVDELCSEFDEIKDELIYEVVTQQSNFSSNVKRQGQTRTHISPELIAGKTYRFHVVLSSSATGDITPILYINSNTSDNTYIGLLNGRITSGKSEITFDYTPSAETNYQYLGWWSVNDVRTANVTISLVETSTLKEHVKSIDNEIEDLTHQVQEYAEMGENIFDISKQTTAQTTAENLSCTKTETGYSFVCTTAASTKNAYGTVGTLVVGEKYRLEFDYTHDLKVTGTYAGLLRLMFSNPLDAGNYQDIIHWILKNYPASGHLSFTFTAEYSTYYLRMAANDIGTGGSVTLSNIRVVNLAKSDYIKSIVDSTIGLPDSGVDTAAVKGYYNGNRIPSIEGGTYEIGYTKVCNSAGQVAQACAAYNGYLFEFLNNNSAVHIYNLAASTPVLHSTVTPTNISTGHCNTACFCSKKYDDADIFPLLYTSGGQTQDYNQVQVYRVTFENDVFTITQVQNITMPAATDVNNLYWAQIYLDNDLGDMWYVGNRGGGHWVKFKIPAIKDDGGNVIPSVVFTDNDAQDEFYTLGFVHQQGGIIVNGYCYIMDGVPAWGDTVYMRVFDVWGKKMINNTVNLTRIGWTYEPEGIGLYDNHFYVNTAGNGIFKFFF